MDIHKPKPWHGVREFLKEYVIIVVGVLTALAAEQGVEWLHWRHEVESQRRALYADIRVNLGDIRYRDLLKPCIDKRLAELDIVFQRHDDGAPLGLIGRVGVPVTPQQDGPSWSLAVSGGGLNHMSPSERLRLGNSFSAFAIWNRDITKETEAWVPLSVLDHPDKLKDTDWAALRIALANARFISGIASSLAPFMLERSSQGQKPDAAMTPEALFKSTGGTLSDICEPLITH